MVAWENWSVQAAGPAAQAHSTDVLLGNKVYLWCLCDRIVPSLCTWQSPWEAPKVPVNSLWTAAEICEGSLPWDRGCRDTAATSRDCPCAVLVEQAPGADTTTLLSIPGVMHTQAGLEAAVTFVRDGAEGWSFSHSALVCYSDPSLGSANGIGLGASSSPHIFSRKSHRKCEIWIWNWVPDIQTSGNSDCKSWETNRERKSDQ